MPADRLVSLVLPTCLSFFLLLTPRAAWAQLSPALPDSDLWEARWDERWDASFWAPAGAFSLDLRAGWERAELRESTYLVAALRVPLDQLIAGPPAQLQAPGEAVEAQKEEASSLPSRGGGEGPDRSSSETKPTAIRASPAASPASVKPLRQDIAQATTETLELPLVLVREVLERARLSAPTDAARARLLGLARRARSSGLTPELRLRSVYGFDQTTSLEQAGLLPGDATTRDGRDSLFEVRLTFRLDRLLFGREEPSLERQRAELDELDARREKDALSWLLKWWKARASCSRTDLLPEELQDALIAREEARVVLHVLTGGWFVGQAQMDALLSDLAASSQRGGGATEMLESTSHFSGDALKPEGP